MPKIIKSGIYCIINIINNKRYVGSSFNIYERWVNHTKTLKKGKHNKRLQNAWNKYGESNFVFEILEEVDINITAKEMEIVEQKWCDYYVVTTKKGYNVRKKCETNKGISPTEETRNKLSISLRKAKKKIATKCLLYNNKGEFVSGYDSLSDLARFFNVKNVTGILSGIKKRLGWYKNHIVRLYEPNYPLKLDPIRKEKYLKEVRDKLSFERKARGIKQGENWILNRVNTRKKNAKPLSEESRKRLSDSHKGQISKRRVDIIKLDIDGNILDNYFSITEAFEKNTIAPVRRSLKTGLYTLNGFRFMKKSDYEKQQSSVIQIAPQQLQQAI